ncbi:hypothetical protein [Litorimonas sp. WD9-15]|uniref:hypothetical protein n=1 Tax=Litorimonas sp. WD9-15 TaxID=3418716 RepID=UPI003CFD63B0
MSDGLSKSMSLSDAQAVTNLHFKPILSCVVDRNPKFLMQAWIWLISAREAGVFNDCEVVVHHVGPTPAVLQSAAQRFGAKLCEVTPFGEGPARYCNKLQSHPPIINSGGPGAIMTDVDLFFFGSPVECWDDDFVQAKIVDHPNPPVELLSQLAEIFSLSPISYDGIPTFRPENRTHALNCNGGLYMFPMPSLESVAPLWNSISTTCLTQEQILGQWLHHSDQIGFLFSMLKTNMPFKPLSLRYNFPTHFKPRFYDGLDIEDIQIVHYHNKLLPSGHLIETGHEGVDAYIHRANQILEKYDDLPEYIEISARYAASL